MRSLVSLALVLLPLASACSRPEPADKLFLNATVYTSIGPETYLNTLRKMKQEISVPVIGSLNGVSTGGWIDYAMKIQDAGADALELNIYYLATDPDLTGAELEDTYVTLVRDIRKQVSIPLAVQLTPFFSALPNFARRLAEAGRQWIGSIQSFLPARFRPGRT